ncbi:MAG: LarC family nickel insertion protein [Clostridia bacterium]
MKKNGYHIEISKKIKNGITGTYIEDINKIIDNSSLDEKVKDLSKRIFMRVANAESKVHNKPLEEVHFHEVGALDSIVDIVGTATSEIFSASNVRFRQIDIDTELVTPTGAAIIAELADEFTVLPEMNVMKIGWGAGSKELKIPNILKVYYGEMERPNEDIVVMETNIDDCTGEVLGYTQELLFKNKALDVFFTPIYMKKNRPAYRMTVVCKKEDMTNLQKII